MSWRSAAWFVGSAVLVVIGLWSSRADALRYRVVPAVSCEGNHTTVGSCGLQLGTEFKPTNIALVDIDFFVPGSVAETVLAQTCRISFSLNTRTCSPYVYRTGTGYQPLSPDPAAFAAGGEWDYRFVYWVTSRADLMLGVYVASTDP